ncbi:MAG: hypothetical protein L0H78_25615, partial [Humibacillus sp.]|nr:hypothetical protein [Humibacillus sp.]
MSNATEQRRINGHDVPAVTTLLEEAEGAAAGGLVRRAGLSPLVVDVPAPGVEAAASPPARYVPAPAEEWPDGVMAPRRVEGPVVQVKIRKAKRVWYAPVTAPAPTTTRQAEILNPALVASPTDDEGVAIGRDLLSNSPVAHDPFTAYQRKVITSPSVIVLGLIGSGKSSLLKTVYV